MSGDTYFVEQYETKDKQIIRRLVFGSNTNVLQTEVEVSKKGAIKNTLVSRYHAAITSGLAAFSKLTKDSNICLIGLGGGALASTLLDLSQRQTKLTVIELDQVIVSVAQDWFGFRTEDTKQILVTDGLTFFDEIHDNYDAIVVDVDAKNPGVGLSCPPVTFLQSDYLCKLARSLKNGGLIVYNLVARDPKALNAAIGPMGSFPTNFADVAVLRPDPDDLNVTVFATRPFALAATAMNMEECIFSEHTFQNARKSLASWLVDIPNMATDPYDLIDLFAKLRKLPSLHPPSFN
mmetsp:Transcript_12132/g.18247  ORF Transcript_12132/g.18247 Transcript_12132/m.18247 type:complete len:292 (-) Transcript_12132:28-903(-)